MTNSIFEECEMRIKVFVLSRAVLLLSAVPLFAFFVMLLWNSVATGAFTGARPIDYVHALGLLVLSRILFGGFRGAPGWHRRRQWEKWQAMTPEERESFRGRMGCTRHTNTRE
jgi:hypothetical protein